MKSKIEILSPIGGMDSLDAALQVGCDAVYLAGKQFGARAYANNFTNEELLQVIDRMHIHDKKVYLTVNTLVDDEELKQDMYAYMAPLVKQGLDAAIVQDVGVLRFLHQYFPELDLHASTQMTLLSAEGAQGLSNYHVTRFVPARELTIDEIKHIRENTALELEVFVHGALCYCYSGQCLMSGMIGNRSGNHGMCAGPCRLTYQEGNRRGHLLSPKDVCTLINIPELVEAGIDSFKIEGRMKQMEYVYLTTYFYRKYVDLYEEKGRQYFEQLRQDRHSSLYQDEKKLMDIFNRGGFCHGYLFEKKWEDIIYPQKCNHFGLKVGELDKVSDRSVTIKLQEDIHYQDVLEIRDQQQNSLYEYTVKDAKKSGSNALTNVFSGLELKTGMSVYRRKNKELLEQCATNSLIKTKKKISGTFTGKINEPAVFEITDGQTSTIVYGPIGQPCQNREITKEDVLAKLSGIGNTEYEWSQLNVLLGKGIFYPLKELKALKRKALEVFEQQYLNRFRGKVLEEEDYPLDQIEVSDEAHVLVSTIEQLKQVMKEPFVDRIYLRFHTLDDFREGTRLCPGCFVRLPLTITDFSAYEWMKNDENIAGMLIGSHEQLAYFSTQNQDKILVMDANMYTTNTYARDFYREEKIDEFTAPYDYCVSWKNVQTKGAQVVYGYVPVMITKGCLNRGTDKCHQVKQVKLTGERGDEFICVMNCEQCTNTIYYLPERNEHIEHGVRRLDFTTETPEEVSEVLKQWKR